MRLLEFLRPVLFLTGLLQLVVAILMLLPALLEIFSGGPDAAGFMDAAFITVCIGLVLTVMSQGPIRNLNVRQMFLLVVCTWTLSCLTSALPFVLTSIDLTYTNAVFEAVSGLTTTGGTVIVGLDRQPGGILLWRSLTQWLGGIGIIGVAVVLFPFMRIGGMQLFKTESSEKGDKVVVQARTFAYSLLGVYLMVSVASLLTFYMAGMNWFDALNHMMAAVSTGGFSTKDASLGYYNSNAIYWAAVFSMLLGALPFTWYMKLVVDTRSAGTDTQVITFLKVMALAWAMMLAWLLVLRPISPGLGPSAIWFDYFTHAATNLTSIITTTGFVTTDYMQWGSFPIALFLIAMFAGGCSGSTSGSIKIMRWQIMFSSLRAHFLKMVQPHRVTPIFYNGRAISDEVKDSATGFIALFLVCWLVLTLLLSLTGLDFDTSLSAAAANITNVGPGIGPIIGPAGNYSSLPDTAKWLLSFAMLLGRLEILVLLLVFTKGFWRD